VAGFDPGDIVSDDAFYNADAMSRAGIQRFLERQSCTPQGDVPCLADYRQTTVTQPTRYAHCARYPGARDERASTIIQKVAQACGISPRVLLVLVQKEQSLVTRPSASGYRHATGYACPDTGGCDARYLGFFNQVYRAAWQFRHYTETGPWRYHVGTVRVQYHPRAACGSSPVRIRNQATANLYDYTPYQPDARTLARPDGPAGRCSTYGNLNFWRIWRQWFGDPTAVRFPAWLPQCLNLVGGHGCTLPSIPPVPPGRARPLPAP